MSKQPNPPEPSSAEPAATADQPSTDHLREGSKYCARVLLDLVEMGHELARMLMREARAREEATGPAAEPAPGPAPTQEVIASYANITRAVRRTVMLYEKLIAEGKAASPAHRIAARKKIIREVEDAIQRNAPESEQESLRAELLERLDRPDLDDEIADRPIGDIVNDINRDLGIAGLHRSHPWKRRIPHDIAVLNALAEQVAGAPPSEKLLALLASAPPPVGGNRPNSAGNEAKPVIRQCGPLPDS